MTAPVSVAFLQLDHLLGEKPAPRVDRVLDLITDAPDADLLVLPELWEVGYFNFDDYAAVGAAVDNPTLEKIRHIAKDRSIVIVPGSFIERDGDSLYNSVPVIGTGGEIVALYRKVHLFGYGSRESELLTAGTDVQVAMTPLGQIGVATCFDLRFPAQFSKMRRVGADMFVVPAAWPSARIMAWRVLVQARAIENQTPIVACNGVGVVGPVQLAGASMAVDAEGNVLASATSESQWLTTTIDPAETARWRAEFPLEETAAIL